MTQLCSLKAFTNGIYFEKQDTNLHGKLEPKNGHTYQVWLRTDNPDISSLKTEERLIHQALEEYQRRLPYKINVFTSLPYPLTIQDVDVFIDFIEPDQYMSGGVLAWGGYPNGSLRGKIAINNKYPWLDGSNRTGAELRKIGLILPGMVDTQLYQTYNVKQTIKHEFGHVLGLDHDDDEYSVMAAYYNVLNILLSETSLRVLEVLYGLRSLPGRWLYYIKSVMKRKIS